jgi:hypothetical protein
MTNEEFLELARQNNAIMTPEESEKCRREFIEDIKNLRFDWDGSPYFINPHNSLQVFVDKCHTELCFGALILYIFWAIIYAPIIFVVLIALLIAVF